MNFKHLKAGDQVYMVAQSRRSLKPWHTEVVKVGRKYGYILEYGRQKPFNLLTGQSVHNDDSNARTNGWGFDVWPSEEAYRAHIATIEANTRLATRLEALRFNQYSSTLEKASPELVADLHAVLDRHGIQ
jgi:hypothetical protein